MFILQNYLAPNEFLFPEHKDTQRGKVFRKFYSYPKCDTGIEHQEEEYS
jgi:hypothetical protein